MVNKTQDFLSDASFFRRRDDMMCAARGCRAALTSPDGVYKYDPRDPRVKKAIKVWVDKARRAHAIAMGRQSICDNFVLIVGAGSTSGALYAK